MNTLDNSLHAGIIAKSTNNNGKYSYFLLLKSSVLISLNNSKGSRIDKESIKPYLKEIPIYFNTKINDLAVGCKWITARVDKNETITNILDIGNKRNIYLYKVNGKLRKPIIIPFYEGIAMSDTIFSYTMENRDKFTELLNMREYLQ